MCESNTNCYTGILILHCQKYYKIRIETILMLDKWFYYDKLYSTNLMLEVNDK